MAGFECYEGHAASAMMYAIASQYGFVFAALGFIMGS